MKTRILALALSLTAVLVVPACSRNDQRPTHADEATTPEAATSLGSQLLGSHWVVLSVDGRALAGARGEVDIEFPEPGRIAGQGPCNRYMASFDQPEGEFRIGQAASTMMACEEPAMADERLFLDVMGGVERAWLQDDELQLVTGDGRQIHARRR